VRPRGTRSCSRFEIRIGAEALDSKSVAAALLRKYRDAIANRKGELEVRGRPHELSASVTWTEVNIYDHNDVALDERIGFRKRRPIRSVDEAAEILEETIQRWAAEGAPPRDP
jgi:hypothetical protein